MPRAGRFRSRPRPTARSAAAAGSIDPRAARSSEHQRPLARPGADMRRAQPYGTRRPMFERRAAHDELSQAEVADQLRALGVEAGGVLLVHTSFRAVRPVVGGPLGLIGALRDALGHDGTLVMPS